MNYELWTNLLIYLTISIFIIFIFFVFYKRQLKINKKFPWIAKNKYFYVKYVFLIFSFFIIFLSIFWIKILTNEKTKVSWVSVVFVLDVSKSMNVADIVYEEKLYTRLLFSKMAISDFIIKNPQNSYSLVIFSWEAISAIPLTNDTNVFLTLLQNLDYKNLTKQGSNFYDAIKFANKRLETPLLKGESEKTWKAIVFISDWAEGDVNLDVESLYKKDIAYFVVWVWTKKGSRIIIWKNAFWDVKYQIYNWKYVISKINEKNLEKLSWVLKSKYLKLSKHNDLDSFILELKKLEKKSLEINNSLTWKDFSRFLWFVSFIFFVIFLGIYIFER